MITSAKAEELAIKVIGVYLLSCSAETPQDVANLLMKLCSVAGVQTAKSVGSVEAIERMQGTIRFLERATVGIRPPQ